MICPATTLSKSDRQAKHKAALEVHKNIDTLHLIANMDRQTTPKKPSSPAESTSSASSNSQTTPMRRVDSDGCTYICPARSNAAALGFEDGDVIRLPRRRRGSLVADGSSPFPLGDINNEFFKGLEWLLDASKPVKPASKPA